MANMNNNSNQNQENKKKWYKQTWAIVLLLIVFFPVGLYLMWKHTNWKKSVKIIITAFFALSIIGSMGSNTSESNKKPTGNNSVVEMKEEADIVEEEKSNEIQEENIQNEDNEKARQSQSQIQEKSIPTEYKLALNKAKSYSSLMNMSKQGIYDQLTSEYGEKFSHEAAQYAVDNIDVDWNVNALKKAKSYQDVMSMSSSAIYDQLTSEYGEKFTPEQAQYAIDNLN